MLGVMLLMVGNGVQGSLLGIRGTMEAFSTFQLSIVMSAYFLGFLIGSRLAPAMIRNVGHVRVFAALGSLISAVLVLYPMMVEWQVWAVMRVVIGFGFAGIYITAESWLNNTVTNETRGQALSAYMIVQMLGIIASQALMGFGDPFGYDLFLIPSVLVSLAFMPIYGLHIAVSILVGERLGENRDNLAARATMTTLQMSWLYMAVISLLYAFLPDLFLVGFFREGLTDSAEQLAVRELTARLLLFVAGYNLLDATQMIYIGALKGAGDTRFLLRVSLVLALLLASFSYLSVEVWRLNVYGCWTLIVFWCLLAAVTYFIRYRGGKWRSMRVIEQTPIVESGEVAALVGD
jgi:MFS family permease